jgi:hypothetical protein
MTERYEHASRTHLHVLAQGISRCQRLAPAATSTATRTASTADGQITTQKACVCAMK